MPGGTGQGTGTAQRGNKPRANKGQGRQGRQRNDAMDQDYGDPLVTNGGTTITVTDQILNRVANGVSLAQGSNWTPRQLKKQIAMCLGI